jgi:hypothetical protein
MNAASDQVSTPTPETLDLLFELSKQAPEEQLRASDAVDSKIFQAFAAASVLVGLAAVSGVKHSNVTAAFVSAAVLAFLVVAASAIWALWTRRYRVTIGPQQLWDRYWSDTPDVIKHAFVADVASGYVENEANIREKHKALAVTLLALLMEAAAIGVALIVSAV